MPTLDWLKKEFHYGYYSGNILSLVPNPRRIREQLRIGGSYRKVFNQAILKYIKNNSKVLELGCGKGSWTKAILKYIPKGELHTIDFQDTEKWLKPNKYNGRLICHKVDDNSFSCVKDDYFDFFWSFGVLCHINIEMIEEILKNSLKKFKKGAIAVHQYAEWDKLQAFGWKKGTVPLEFRDKPDDEIWWPRNTRTKMKSIAEKAGWSVITSDLEIVKREAIIVLRKD